MKARRLGVSTIWAMFSRVRSKTSGSSLASRKVSTSLTNASCSVGEFEVHGCGDLRSADAAGPETPTGGRRSDGSSD